LKDAGLPHRFSAGDSFALTGPSWQAATPGERSHDSRTYTERFMLRLNNTSALKLQELVDRFDVPKAEIIRHLITQAKPEDFPKGWHVRAAERRMQQARP
jgi:hypothetical protein